MSRIVARRRVATRSSTSKKRSKAMREFLDRAHAQVADHRPHPLQVARSRASRVRCRRCSPPACRWSKRWSRWPAPRGNIVFENAVLKMRDEVATGQRLQRAMENTGLFPNMVIQMIAVGEEAGALDAMSGKVATFYEAEVDNAVDSHVEPARATHHGHPGRARRRPGHRDVPADLQARARWFIERGLRTGESASAARLRGACNRDSHVRARAARAPRRAVFVGTCLRSGPGPMGSFPERRDRPPSGDARAGVARAMCRVQLAQRPDSGHARPRLAPERFYLVGAALGMRLACQGTDHGAAERSRLLSRLDARRSLPAQLRPADQPSATRSMRGSERAR